MVSNPSVVISLVACFDTRGYLYDGNEYRIPCNTTAVQLGEHSSCCGPNDMCLTNGLCKQQGEDHEKDDLYWSNGCTDSNFNDPACPQYCMKTSERNGTNALVRYCPVTGDWCCAAGPGRTKDDCCDEDSRRFKAKDQEPAPSGIYRTLTHLSADITSTRTLNAITLAPTPTSSTNSSTTVSTTSSAPLNTPTESEPAPPESTGSNTGLKLGLGVGLALGFVGLIVVAVMLYLNYRRKNTKALGVLSWMNAGRAHVYGDWIEIGANETSLAEMNGQAVLQEVAAIRHDPVELGDTGRR